MLTLDWPFLGCATVAHGKRLGQTSMLHEAGLTSKSLSCWIGIKRPAPVPVCVGMGLNRIMPRKDWKVV